MKLKELTYAGLLEMMEPCGGTPVDLRPAEKRPTVLDFYVPWCEPCQVMAPVLEEVAAEYAGRVDFYKIDIDKERRAAVRFKLRHVPAVAFYPAAGPCRLEIRAMTKAALREAVERLLEDKPQENATD